MSIEHFSQIPTLISGEESFKRSLPQQSGLQCNAAAFQMLDLCVYL